MRSSRIFALIVVVFALAPSFAGAQGGTPEVDRASRGGRTMGRGAGGPPGVLRGLKLSDVERAKIQEIRGTYRKETQAVRESLRPALQEARAARQKGDTVTARAVFERTSGDREKLRGLRQRQAADVRAALSPEHQKRFDARVQQARQWRAEGKRQGGMGKRQVRSHQGRRARPVPNA